MKRITKILLITTLLALSACRSARPPATFEIYRGLSGEIVEFRPDYSFRYTWWTDLIGDEWIAEGTWKWMDDDQVRTEIVSVNRPFGTCPPLAAVEDWIITSRGLEKGWTPLFRPKSPPIKPKGDE